MGQTTTSAGTRARLGIVQTVYGGLMGVEICAVAGCGSSRAWVGSALLGAGAGATASVLATRGRHVRTGTAVLFNTAPLVGTLLTFHVVRATARRENEGDWGMFENRRAVTGGMIAGQLASYGVAFGVDRWLSPTSGETSTALSGAAWLNFFVGLGVNAGVRDRSYDEAFDRRFSGTMALVTVGGLAAGGALGHRLDVSAGRALAVDGGGAIGAGMGALVTYFVGGDEVDARALAWSAIGGGLVGLGSTFYLTRNMPRDHEASSRHGVAVAFSPMPGGGLAQVSGLLR